MSMRWLFADDFLSMILAYRLCWIRGRFGGGKTSLAVALAAWLISNGYVSRCLANFPVCFSVEPSVPINDSVVILDEAFLYLSDRLKIYDYAAYLRKLNLYLLMPSVFPVHYRVGFFSVTRIFNFQVVGLPLWLYRWDLNMNVFRERGYFALWGVTSLYGLYDTLYIPDNDGGIADAFSASIPKFHSESLKKISYASDIDDAVARAEEVLLRAPQQQGRRL